MEPISTAAVISSSAISAGAQGGSAAMSNAQADKQSKRAAKENKRKTLAELYRDALKREMDTKRFATEQSGLNTARRQQALQETSNGFTRALQGK